MNSDDFTVRWTRTVQFAPGNYRFRIIVDDGARLWVNNALIIDQWKQQSATEYSSDIYVPGGAIPIRLEYVEYREQATIKLYWAQIGGGSGGSGSGGDASEETTKPVRPKSKWRGEYYNNPDVAGNPTLVREDSRIDFDWGYGSPDPGHQRPTTFRCAGPTPFASTPASIASPPRPTTVCASGWTTSWSSTNGACRRGPSTAARLAWARATTPCAWNTRSWAATLSPSSPSCASSRGRPLSATSSPVCRPSPPTTPGSSSTGWIPTIGGFPWAEGIGAINPTGFLKIDGLPINVNRFGNAGEPYKVEQWIDGKVARSTGDFLRGEPGVPRAALCGQHDAVGVQSVIVALTFAFPTAAPASLVAAAR